MKCELEAAPEDLPFTLELFNRELGDPLYTPSGLERDRADPEAVILVARSEGAALGRLLIAEDFSYYERFGAVAVRAFEAGPPGSIEALAVVPAARGRGVGRSLLEAMEQRLFALRPRTVVAVGWDSGRASALPLFRKLGYEESARVDRFYEDESRRDGWRCPVDGTPCLCGAYLFTKTIAAGQPAVGRGPRNSTIAFSVAGSMPTP